MNRFPDGARVCFVGDSLTAANLTLPRIIDYYNKHFPNHSIRFFNCGVSGGTYTTAITIFEDDVLPHNPTHIVVACGINDSSRGLLSSERSAQRLETLHQRFETYQKQVDTYCSLAASHGIQLILCTPAPYDEYSGQSSPALRGGYALMLGYADFIRNYAKEKNIELCDYHDYISQQLETDTAPIYSPDRIHPTEHGYYLIACAFLSHQGLTPDAEAPIPEHFSEWSATVKKLRTIFGAEQMIIHGYHKPLEEKLEIARERLRLGNFNPPILEDITRGFLEEKCNQDALYEKIDRLYEQDILHNRGAL